MTAMRDAFEAWAVSSGNAYQDRIGLWPYPSFDIHSAWRAWQAAIASANQKHETELTSLRECIEFSERMLTNMQPHVEQACHPGRAGFIDNYVDPVLERLRAFTGPLTPPHDT